MHDTAPAVWLFALILKDMIRHALLFVHFSSAVVWVGGMFFAYFCLRPAAGRLLEPAQRLPLWQATLDRFFRFTAAAVALLLASGWSMLLETGFSRAPIGWHLMSFLGSLMAVIFVYVYGFAHRRLRGHCEASAWPAAASALNEIRRLVAVNLALAVCTVAAAAFSR